MQSSTQNIHELSNPAWASLSGRHKNFNRGDHKLKYYPADVSPFLAVQNWDEKDFQILNARIPADRSFSMVVETPVELPSTFEILFALPLYQMVCENFHPFPGDNFETIRFTSQGSIDLVSLHDDHIPQMLELTAMTKPGPFYASTIDLGTYIGILEDEKLVAMAGERMKTNQYTELSAICTHPDYIGKNYASILISKLMARVIEEGFTPFLHVKKDNDRAIHVYEKFGFRKRCEMFFTVFRKRS